MKITIDNNYADLYLQWMREGACNHETLDEYINRKDPEILKACEKARKK